MTSYKHKFPILKIALLLSALLFLVAIGTWFYRVQEQEMRKKAEESLITIAQMKVGQIVDWRHERLGDACVLSENSFFVQGMAQFITSQNGEKKRAILAYLRSMQVNYRYADILLIDANAKVLFGLSGTSHSKDRLASALAKAFQEHTPVFIDLHKEPQDGPPHISVVAPLFSDTENARKPIGAVILISDASQFLYPLIQSWPTPRTTAETLLVRRDEDDVLFLNNLRHQANTALKLRFPLNRNDLPASMAVSGQKGIVTGRDYRGVEVLAAIFPVPESPWFMVAKVDAAEIFAAWRFLSALIIALILGFAIVIGTTGLLLWQLKKKSHFQALYLVEARLRASMERHSVTLKSIGDAVIATDAQCRVDLLNPVAEELTGWTDDEARGRPVEEVFHIVNEQTRQIVQNPVSKVLHEGIVVGLANHTLLIARNGTERPIADSGAPICNESGEITGVVLVFRDQTKERAATEALLQSEKKFRTIFEYMGPACCLDEIIYNNGKAIDYRILDVNPSYEQLIGIPRAQAVGALASELYNTDQAPNLKTYATVDATGEPAAFDALFPPTGKHLRIIASRIAPGRLCILFTDVTERKRAEEERERLLSAIEQAGEMIVITDSEGTIQYVNPAFEKVTGYTRTEAIGNNPRILKSGEHDVLFYQSLWATISSGGTFQGRLVNKRKDGTLFTEEATITPVRDATGRIVNYVAVKHDITDHLRVAEQLIQAQKMESVGRLAGGVAHDYNNMLSVILGFTELAMDKVDASTEVYANLEEILSATKRSAEITRQLLAFARKQTVEPKVLELNKIVENMLNMLRRLIGEDIDLSWRPGKQLWPIKIDLSQLEQVMANLCVNARDAIATVGKITIETGMVTIDDAYCADHAGFIPGEFAVLSVSDDGCGMDKVTLDNIYEPFFTTKEKDKGTGLGLAMVYGIVKQSGGFINVYSEPGEGTTFKIYFPKHAGKPDKIQSEVTTEIITSRGEMVLFVEDDSAIRKVGQKMLEKLGYEVVVAGTPDEAIQLAAEHFDEIHLLITDVVMPGMNGRDLANRLGALYPAIKTLFMSGYTANVIAHRGVLEAGVQFIHKPFSLKDLGLKIRRILD